MKNFSIEIKWGVLFSIVSLAWMLLEKTVGLHDQYIAKQAMYTNLFGLVAIGIYILALSDKKKNFYKNKMTWKQGFLSGMALSVVVSLLSPVVQYLSFTYITPTFFSHIISYAVANKVQTQTQAEAYFNLKSYIIQGIFGALSMGVITAAIVALMVKTKNYSNEN